MTELVRYMTPEELAELDRKLGPFSLWYPVGGETVGEKVCECGHLKSEHRYQPWDHHTVCQVIINKLTGKKCCTSDCRTFKDRNKLVEPSSRSYLDEEERLYDAIGETEDGETFHFASDKDSPVRVHLHGVPAEIAKWEGILKKEGLSMNAGLTAGSGYLTYENELADRSQDEDLDWLEAKEPFDYSLYYATPFHNETRFAYNKTERAQRIRVENSRENIKRLKRDPARMAKWKAAIATARDKAWADPEKKAARGRAISLSKNIKKLEKHQTWPSPQLLRQQTWPLPLAMAATTGR